MYPKICPCGRPKGRPYPSFGWLIQYCYDNIVQCVWACRDGVWRHKVGIVQRRLE